jgi:hypothetical protein
MTLIVEANFALAVTFTKHIEITTAHRALALTPTAINFNRVVHTIVLTVPVLANVYQIQSHHPAARLVQQRLAHLHTLGVHVRAVVYAQPMKPNATVII